MALDFKDHKEFWLSTLRIIRPGVRGAPAWHVGRLWPYHCGATRKTSAKGHIGKSHRTHASYKPVLTKLFPVISTCPTAKRCCPGPSQAYAKIGEPSKFAIDPNSKGIARDLLEIWLTCMQGWSRITVGHEDLIMESDSPIAPYHWHGHS